MGYPFVNQSSFCPLCIPFFSDESQSISHSILLEKRTKGMNGDIFHRYHRYEFNVSLCDPTTMNQHVRLDSLDSAPVVVAITSPFFLK